jgi:hypothetical protein
VKVQNKIRQSGIIHSLTNSKNRIATGFYQPTKWTQAVLPGEKRWFTSPAKYAKNIDNYTNPTVIRVFPRTLLNPIGTSEKITSNQQELP